MFYLIVFYIFPQVTAGTFHTIKFLASFAMMPRAKLLVYTVINGEFVYDEQVIQLQENLLNAVIFITTGGPKKLL